jgi:hypothetical protein
MPVEIIQPQEGYVRILGVGNPIVPTEVEYEVQGGTTGTQPTFSGTPLFNGSYVRAGAICHFRIDVDFDNITSFGTGQYYLTLPFPAKYNYQLSDGALHHVSTGRNYPIFGDVAPGSNEIYLESLDSQGNSVFQVDFTGTAPITLAIADSFHVSGTYIIEEEN